jgi:GNAT superfamily N-acetyltransferase
MPIHISLDHKDLQLDRVHIWLSGSYWSPGIRRDVLERAFSRSLVASAIDASGTQVGIARVITDWATFAYLCDVYVDESCRGQGIARQMLTVLFAHPDLQTLRHWALATRDAHSLYAAFGFVPVPDGRWMRLPLPHSNWQDPSHTPAT